MKCFQIITESDARVLEHGSTVTLGQGGLITPLAADTLRDRRVTVVRESGDADATGLAPVGLVRVVAIGSDQDGVALKQFLLRHLRAFGFAVHDVGGDVDERAEYPDSAAAVARQVARREADAGIVIDDSGLGSAIAANKVRGVRAAVCLTTTQARYARQRYGAHVVALGTSLVEAQDACEIVDLFLRTGMRDPRDVRLLLKIRNLETEF